MRLNVLKIIFSFFFVSESFFRAFYDWWSKSFGGWSFDYKCVCSFWKIYLGKLISIATNKYFDSSWNIFGGKPETFQIKSFFDQSQGFAYSTIILIVCRLNANSAKILIFGVPFQLLRNKECQEEGIEGGSLGCHGGFLIRINSWHSL